LFAPHPPTASLQRVRPLCQVLRACTSLVPPNKLDSDAVDARSEIDLRTGAAFTRFQVRP